MDSCAYTRRPATFPGLIVKDSAARVLATVASGDSTTIRNLVGAIEPEMIGTIDIVRDSSLTLTLGRGFENGLIVITLSPAGTLEWQRRASAKSRPRGAIFGAMLGAREVHVRPQFVWWNA